MFEANYSSDFYTVNRMDIINLAGTQKYNALGIFQRVIFILYLMFYYLDTSKNRNIIKKVRVVSNYYWGVSAKIKIKGKIKG